MKLLRSAGLILLGVLFGLSARTAYPVVQGGEHGAIARILVEYSDGSTEVFLPSSSGLSTPTPLPTATVPPTSSPTPTLTPTPLPTAWITPMPTPTPETACWITSTDNVNVRAGPGTSFTILGVAPLGTMTQVLAQTVDGDWLKVWWFPKNAYGWTSAVYWTKEGDCGALPVAFNTQWGPWVGVGAQRDELYTFGEALQAAGRQPAATVYGEPVTAVHLHDRGWLVAVRPYIGDCADTTLPAAESARRRVDESLTNLGVGYYDWIVLTNECGWPSAEYAHDWIVAAVARAKVRGIKRLVPVVWSPGRPELYDIDTLAAAYVTDGIELCWGMNLYPVPAKVGLAEHTALTAYTTFRYRKYRADLPPGLPLCVTEFARADGSEPPDWGDIQRFVEETDGEFLWATAWYTAMPLGHWTQATMRGQLDRLAVALIPTRELLHGGKQSGILNP